MAANLLGLIQCFIKVVEAGSIAAAARALGMSAAAVSQNVARLEAHLGVRLLSRTTRRMALTQSGALYYDKVRHIPHDLDLAQTAATDALELQGTLRIATTSVFGRHKLAPLLPAFQQRYPRIAIELISTDRRTDHRLEGIDVSLRIPPQLDDRLIARHIATYPFVFCASPAYLARAGTPQTPEDLKQHACLVFRYPVDGRFLPWKFVRNGQRFDAPIQPGFICDDIEMLAQIALNDGGVVRLADFVAQPLIDGGKLRPLFETAPGDVDGAVPEPMEIYACVAERAALNTRVRAFIEFVAEALQAPLPHATPAVEWSGRS